MTFTEAVEILLAGGKVRRKSWFIASAYWQLPVGHCLSRRFGDPAVIERDDIEATDWEEAK